MIIAHVINPVNVDIDNLSYLYQTQPITFKSMFESKIYSENASKDLVIEL